VLGVVSENPAEERHVSFQGTVIQSRTEVLPPVSRALEWDPQTAGVPPQGCFRCAGGMGVPQVAQARRRSLTLIMLWGTPKLFSQS